MSGGLFIARADLLCVFLFLLFARSFFATLLIDNFHRQAHFATIVKAQQLDPDLLTFFENV